MGNLTLNGSTSGSITIAPPAVAGSNTLTLPAATTTLVDQSTTDTLTNKTLSSPTISGTPVMSASLLTSATAQASTSGTSIDFTSIPSWVKRINVIFNGVSVSGTSNLLIQLGAGSVTTSGYSCYLGYVVNDTNANSTSATTGIGIYNGNASNNYFGNTFISLISGNTWVGSYVFGSVGGGAVAFGGGSIALSGTLDRLRITTVNGTDTFDAGSVNIVYE